MCVCVCVGGEVRYLVCDELPGPHLGGLFVGEGADGEGQGGEPPVDLVEKHAGGLDLQEEEEEEEEEDKGG